MMNFQRLLCLSMMQIFLKCIVVNKHALNNGGFDEV